MLDGHLYRIPHGMLYTLTKEGSSSNWKNGKQKTDELLLQHCPINAQGCVSIVMEYKPNCMKNVPEEDAVTAVHSALPRVDVGNDGIAPTSLR